MTTNRDNKLLEFTMHIMSKTVKIQSRDVPKDPDPDPDPGAHLIHTGLFALRVAGLLCVAVAVGMFTGVVVITPQKPT